MKKFLLFLSLFTILTAFFINEASAYQITADVKTKRIPLGTKLELEMAHNVSLDSANTGDMFSAYLTRDVRTPTTMILPRGTVVRGNVSNIVEPKRLSRSGVLYLNFDHVVAPNGAQLPIKAGLCEDFRLDENGGIKGGGGYGEAVKENWSNSGAIIKKSTKWGITSGEDLFKGGKYLVTPFAAVGGTVAGAGYFVGTTVADLFHKGKGVDLAKGQVFNILLLESLDVPVSE